MVMWRLADWHWGIINQRLPSRSLDLIIRSRFRPSLMWNNFLKQGQAVLWKIGFVIRLSDEIKSMADWLGDFATKILQKRFHQHFKSCTWCNIFPLVKNPAKSWKKFKCQFLPYHVKKQNPAIRQSFIIYNVPPKKWHLFLNLIIWFQNVFFFHVITWKKGEKANATFLGTPCSPIACNIIQAFFYENEELNFHPVIRNRKNSKILRL